MTRSWLAAVVCRRSSASVAQATAESKPNVNSVPRDRCRSSWARPRPECRVRTLLGDAQRAVAADGDKRKQTQRFHSVSHSLEQFLRQRATLAVADFGGESPAVRRAENRAAPRQQSAECLVIERDGPPRFEQTFVATKKADAFPAAVRRSFRDGANHRVQARTISAARDNADSLAHMVILLSVRPTRRRDFRG